LLEATPQIGFFSHDWGNNKWSNPPGQGLFVDSKHWSLFALGSLPDKARLDVSATPGPDPVLCGVFWGLQSLPAGESKVEEQCLLAVVDPDGEGEANAMVRLYRFHVVPDADFLPSISTPHEYARVPLNVDWSKPIDFVLDISAGELTALRVQGQPVEFPWDEKPPAHLPDWKAFTGGRCGVVARQHRVTFTRALLLPH
jgi:hypothetical protein